MTSLIELRLLRALLDGPAYASELATRLVADRTSLLYALRRLERDGWLVSREAGERRRRYYNLVNTVELQRARYLLTAIATELTP